MKIKIHIEDEVIHTSIAIDELDKTKTCYSKYGHGIRYRVIDLGGDVYALRIRSQHYKPFEAVLPGPNHRVSVIMMRDEIIGSDFDYKKMVISKKINKRHKNIKQLINSESENIN